MVPDSECSTPTLMVSCANAGTATRLAPMATADKAAVKVRRDDVMLAWLLMGGLAR